MNKKIILLAILAVFMASNGSAALQAYVIESGPSEYQNLIYNWGDSSTNKYYQDGIAYQADLGIMVCDDSGGTPTDKWVGASYRMNGGVTGRSVLTSYGSGSRTLALADISTSFNGMNCKRTGYSSLTISPSLISGTPPTKIAAFPAEIYVQVADDSSGGGSQYIKTNSVYSGSYSGSTTYSYDNNEITTSISSITVDSDIGTQSFTPGASGRGITTKRPLLVGVCETRDGQICPEGADKLTTANFPLSYSFTETPVDDQHVYRRYAVANGKRYSTLDIGANSDVTSLSVSKDPIYYSQNQTIDFTITNTGNVPVTSEFDVTLEISGGPSNSKVYEETFTISQDIAENGGSISRSTKWEALEKSGQYTVVVRADSNDDLNEIFETDNAMSASFELRTITLPKIYVNGEQVPKQNVTFPDPGVPYNFTVKMRNSDNVTLDNSTVRIVEKHGLSAFSPTQRIDNNTVVNTTNKMSFKVNSNGRASVTIIPTGNMLLSDKYNNLSIQKELNYSIKLKGTKESGRDFKFINDGKLQNYYPLSVSDPGEYDGEGTGKLPNLDKYAKLAMNGVYTMFSEFWGAVT